MNKFWCIGAPIILIIGVGVLIYLNRDKFKKADPATEA